MPRLTVALLGGFHVTVDGVTVDDFPTDKIRALLAYLALHGGQPQRRSHLAALFWSDQDEAGALANLRRSLYRLRQTLERAAPGLADAVLDSAASAVLVRPAAVAVDVVQLDALLEQCTIHAHPRLETCTDCLERLMRAADLVAGELLAGVSVSGAPLFEEWLTVRREALHHQALDALYLATESCLLHGRHTAAQQYALRQLALEPWREAAHRQLMRLYSAAGRPEQALAQYEACRAVLDEELGLTPSAETEQLRAQLIPSGAPTLARHGFPGQWTPFVGRDDAVEAVTAHLLAPQARLITITGTGGIGKTRLAVQTVTRLETTGGLFDAAYFVPLVDVTTADGLVAAIGERLGVADEGRRSRVDQVLALLRAQPTLLVLDNYDQLLPETALIERILRDAPQTTLLVTSRLPLSLRAEWRVPLSGLLLPPEGGDSAESPPVHDIARYPAVQLFVSAARQVRAGFDLTGADAGDAPAVARICRILAGVPLALEIAASWLTLYTPAALADALAHSLAFLETSQRDVPERHRSLRVVFEQTWALLPPAEQRAFARLTVFADDFALDAVHSVVDATPVVLKALVDHALIQPQQNGRIILHPLLREFAEAYLADADDVAARHAAHYLRPNSAAPAQIGADSANVRRAWRWATGQRRADLLASGLPTLEAYYRHYGFYRDGRDQFAAAAAALAGAPDQMTLVNRLRLAEVACRHKLGELEAATEVAQQVVATGDPATLTPGVLALAHVYELRGEAEQALACLQQAETLLADGTRPALQAEVYHLLGRVHRYRNDSEAGIAALKRALALNERVGNEAGSAENHATLSLIYKDIDQYPTAVMHIRQALDLARRLNLREKIAQFTQNLGLLYWQTDDLAQARACYEQALAIAEALQHKRGAAHCIGGLGVIARREYRYQDALAHYERALRLAVELDDKAMQAIVLGNAGNVYYDLGEAERAIDYLQRAAALDRAGGAIGGVCRHLGNIGDTLREQGRFAEALAYFEEALPQLRQIGARYYLCWVLVSYGDCLLELGRADEARRANAEAGAVAAEIDRRQYALLSGVLAARLLAHAGDDAAAQAQLDALQARFDGGEDSAEIAFTRWLVAPQPATRDHAVALTADRYRETGMFRYRSRLLRLGVTPPPR